MMMNGTNGSQVWDAAFTIQAMVESGILAYFFYNSRNTYVQINSGLAEVPEFKNSLLKAFDFLDLSQVCNQSERKSWNNIV
jgi:hypothetical protein